VDRASAFSFFDFGRKKSRRWPGLFFVLLLVFFEGVLENVRFSCGVFVVRLWWIRGELWRGDDCSVVGQKCANFLKYFCGFSKSEQGLPKQSLFNARTSGKG
jgi:hypothetical protein